MSFSCDNNRDECDNCKYPINNDTCYYTITDKTTKPYNYYRGQIPCSRNIDNIIS